jgi:hypothetical protein
VVRSSLRGASLLAALALLGACGGREAEAPAPASRTPAPADAPAPGRIVGHVILAGKAPAAPAIDMSADARCVTLHDAPVPRRDVLADAAGRLANVLVSIAGGPAGGPWEPPAESVLLDQVGCLFVPRVIGLRAGQRLVVRNSDPTLHNVNAHPGNNPESNFGQPFQGMETTLVFANPEDVFALRCDTHPWMRAYVAVFDHPFFAVTSPDGAFAIEGVPSGDYTIRAWHERFGVRNLQVRVTGSATAELDIDFEPRR